MSFNSLANITSLTNSVHVLKNTATTSPAPPQIICWGQHLHPLETKKQQQEFNWLSSAAVADLWPWWWEVTASTCWPWVMHLSSCTSREGRMLSSKASPSQEHRRPLAWWNIRKQKWLQFRAPDSKYSTDHKRKTPLLWNPVKATVQNLLEHHLDYRIYHTRGRSGV